MTSDADRPQVPSCVTTLTGPRRLTDARPTGTPQKPLAAGRA
jgi:hypothetical protein